MDSINSLSALQGAPLSSNTSHITVNRTTLTTARNQVCVVARRLQRIENLSELDWEELNDLCRTIHHATSLLDGLLSAEMNAAHRPLPTGLTAAGD